MMRTFVEQPYPSLDNAPGCTRGDLFTFEKLLTANGLDVPVNLGYTTFMPTLSLLDINLPMDDSGLLTSFPTNEAIIASGLTPFQAVWASPDVNLRHVELTPAMTAWTLQQLAIGLAEAGNAALNLTAGQTFNYGKRKNRVPNTVVNSGATLAVNLGGTINYMTPADPPADLPHFEVYTGGGCSLGKTVTIENGGLLQIGDPGSAKTGVFHALHESVVRVKSGGTLRISNSSGLLIYKGATLILDPGAIVQLESPEAKIHIAGKLVVNGDIAFSGPGYFEFAQANIFELGPGYQTFLLSGTGLNNRFIRIVGDAQLRVPAGRNIDLHDGKVECHGELFLSEGSGGSFTSIFFHGSGNGVRGEQSGSLHVRNCRFESNGLGIELLGGNGTARVENSQFADYSLNAIHLQNRYNLELLNSTLESAGALDAVHAQGVLVVIQRETTISAAQSGTYSNNGPSPNNDPLTVPPPITGVRLEGGWLYWMDGGEISNADVGIANLDGYPTNVYMNHFATIRDCYAGIAMRGNATTGLVAMNCARLINNYFGIHGRDVTLLIDPALLNGQSTQMPNSNVFIRPVSYGPVSGSEYLHICYGLKTPPNPIPATQNYWGNDLGGVVTTDPSPADHVFLCYVPASTGSCGIDPGGCTMIGLNATPSVGRQPTGCPLPGLLCEDPDGVCTEECVEAVTGGESPTIRGQFLIAMDRLHEEDFPEAKAGFQPPADLWGSASLSFTTVCRTYVDAARSLVDGEGFGGEGGEERVAQPDPVNRVQLRPNPASGEVILSLSGPASSYSLRVWNARGELSLAENLAGNTPEHRLDSSAWPPGLYFVELRTQDGSFSAVQKMLIQR